MRLLAGEHHAAIDDPRRDRRELAGSYGHHRLVEERQAFAGSAEPDQYVALLVRCEREQVGVAEALAERGGLTRGGGRGLEVAARLILEDQWQQQIALLDVISLFAVEDAPGAAEPAPGATHLSAGGERHPDPEGVAHGGKCLAGVQPCAACSLQRVQVVLLTAEHVGRGGEQLEVLRAEAGLRVGCGERLARRRPGARRVRAATPL